ncbi:hypothetical protein PINS_up015293 [Pythium insidiosum]|nr:hypothetical protein PINS_up015293 [Pythium insidiosum]
MARQTRKLPLNTFLTDRNTIPAASISDYAARFAECLAGCDEDYETRLRSITGTLDSFRLDLSMRLCCLAFSTSVAYSFELKSVPLERIDVVEAKLRDHDDVVYQMRKSLAFAQFTSDESVLCGVAVEWIPCKGLVSEGDFGVSSDSTDIKIMRSGVYQIQVEVETNWLKPHSWGVRVNGVVIFKPQIRALSRLCYFNAGDFVSLKSLSSDNTIVKAVMILRQLQ